MGGGGGGGVEVVGCSISLWRSRSIISPMIDHKAQKWYA